MEWYAKAGRQTKPSSYQHSHSGLDWGRYANREQTQATHTYAPTEMLIDQQKWDTVCIQFTFQSSSAKQINKGVLSVATLCRGSKRMGKRERENSGEDSENGSWGQKALPLPSPLPNQHMWWRMTHLFFYKGCVYVKLLKCIKMSSTLGGHPGCFGR